MHSHDIEVPVQPDTIQIHLRERSARALWTPNPGANQRSALSKTLIALNGTYRARVELGAVRSTIRWFTYKF